MCKFNYVMCFCCFRRVDRFPVTLCGERTPDFECELSRHLFFDAEYACMGCIKLKCGDQCKKLDTLKRDFFQLFNTLPTRPGSEQAVYAKLKNLLYFPHVPASFAQLSKVPDLDSCYNFHFSFFD